MDFNTSLAKLRIFFADGIEKKFDKNEVILNVDEEPKWAYWILSGHVKVTSSTSAGEERVHHIFQTNELFPVGWIFTSTPILADYVALDKARVRVQPKVTFEKFIQKHPDTLNLIIRQMLALYGSVFSLNLDPARKRVAYQLLTLSERFCSQAKSIDGFVRIDLSLTQKDIASSVRVTRETAAKILVQLESEDAILMGRRIIRVRPEKLRQILLES